MLLQIGVMGRCYCWHGWCRGSCVQCWPWLCSLMFELFWCHCNPWQQWGWVGAALHPLVSCWHVGPRWAPAPGILHAGESCGDRGALAEERGELPVPSPCLCLLSSLHPQPCLWPGPAQSVTSLPWQMCWEGHSKLWESLCGPFAWCLSSPATGRHGWRAVSRSSTEFSRQGYQAS